MHKGILVNDESPELYHSMNTTYYNHCKYASACNAGIDVHNSLSCCWTDTLLRDKGILCDLISDNNMKGQKEKHLLTLILVLLNCFTVARFLHYYYLVGWQIFFVGEQLEELYSKLMYFVVEMLPDIMRF